MLGFGFLDDLLCIQGGKSMHRRENQCLHKNFSSQQCLKEYGIICILAVLFASKNKEWEGFQQWVTKKQQLTVEGQGYKSCRSTKKDRWTIR